MKQVLFRIHEDIKEDVEILSQEFKTANSDVISESITTFINEIKNSDIHFLLKPDLVEYQFLKEVVKRISEEVDISCVEDKVDISIIKIGYFKGICKFLEKAQEIDPNYNKVLNICEVKIGYIMNKMSIFGVKEPVNNPFQTYSIDLNKIANRLREIKKLYSVRESNVFR